MHQIRMLEMKSRRFLVGAREGEQCGFAISLVIFFALCVCACAHNTPGNNVPARPIPEQVFMKFRRSTMHALPICALPQARA
jgi:hypothetical protein